MPIQVLPPEVAGKIAAGEVVERPASVVKELVENSIDAGASEVRVEIRDGGRRLIRVADNGSGIPEAEVALAFARHATSKLVDVSDLDCISSLGFRGEALASIAAVSQVTLLTRPREQAVGQILRVDGGQITSQRGQGCPAGTIVTVEHLFRTVPARLKFLRQPQTETGHIHTVVTHYALAYPQIRISLSTDGRQSFQSTGNGKLHDTLIAVHGLEVAQQMLEIIKPQELDGADEALSVPQGLSAPSIHGYTSLPSLHRANRRFISFFVNRRWIQDRSLAHAVAQAYHTLLPIGRHPVAVVLLEIDPGEVDVNVHPTKREVKFRDGRKVFAAVQRMVRRTLVERAPVPMMPRTVRTWPTPDWERRQRLALPREEAAPSSQLALELYRTADLGEEPEPVGPIRLPLLRVVGQVGQTYVVAEGPQGMYLIDQHAAHERVLYEQLMSDRSKQTVASQTLLEPVTLELDSLQAGTMAENLDMLNQVGFDLHPFGGTSYLVRAVPSVFVVPDVGAALVDLLEMLREGDDPMTTKAEERLVAAVCKRAAIKAGTTLAHNEMEQLVRQLEQCESPRTCPHGRPTVLHFSVEQLEKEFGRR
jgi:DNA mismatch repair protein MutL